MERILSLKIINCQTKKSNIMENGKKEIFTRHRGPVTCAAGIPGTELVVTSAYDSAVAIFDPASGDVDLLGYHDHLANRIKVDPSGKWAASSSSDYTVYIWDIENRSLSSILRGHSDDVEDFTFVDDHTGVSVGRDWRILVWNLDTGAIRRVIEGHEMDVLSVSYHEGKLITSGDDMTLRVWDINTGEEIRKWGPFETETDTCDVDTINGHVVLGCDDGFIRVFDLNNGDTIGEIEAHESAIKKVACSPVNGDILSAAYDQKILIWDQKSHELKVTLEGSATKWERSFNWSPGGNLVLAGTFDGTVQIWDASSGKLMSEIGDQKNTIGNACFNDAASDKNGNIVLVSDDGYIREGKLTPSIAEWSSKTESNSGRMLMNGVAVSADNGHVAGGAHNQKLHLFTHAHESLTNEIEVFLSEGPINCIRYSDLEGYKNDAFVACYSGAIVQVGSDGTIKNTFNVHENAVKALRLHPTKPIGVSCSADGILASWDFDGNLIRNYVGHMAIIDDVDIDPSGQFIASTGRDFTAKVYSLDDGALLHSVSIGRRSSKGILFLDSDTIIVTNYWGELIRIDLRDESSFTKVIAQNGISAVSRSGDHIVAVSYDGSAYLVDPTDLSVINKLQAMVQRVPILEEVSSI
jgi:WD40 repeat protein